MSGNSGGQRSDAVRDNIVRLYIIKVAKWFMLVMPVIVPFYEENGLSLESIYILKSIYSVAIVVFEIPSGYLADMIGRKNTLIAGAILGTAGYVIYSFSYGFAGFVAAELVLGAGLSMVSGADSALLYDSLAQYGEEKQYTRYEGKVTSIGNFAESFAGLAGGALALISLRIPFYVQAAVAFMAIPAALTLWEPEGIIRGKRIGLRGVLETVRLAILSDKKLRINIFYSSAIGAATLSMAWFIQPYFEMVEINLAWFGILWTTLNVAAGIVSAYAYRIEGFFGEKTTLILLSICIPAGFVITGLTGSKAGLGVIFFFYLVRGLATPVLKDYINRMTASEMRATVLSVRNFMIRIIFAILAPATGHVADIYNIGKGLLFTGLVFAIIIAPLLFVYLRHLSAQEAEGGEV